MTGGTIDSTANLTDFTTLTVNNSGASAFSGNLTAGGGSLVKQGGGTLTLSGAATYGGTTTVSDGTLDLQGGGGDGSNYNGGNLSINGASTLRISGLRYNFNGKTFAFDSTGGGTIDAISSGAGGTVFMGNNTFATSGGAQNIMSGTKSGPDNKGFNLNGQTAVFEVETGSDATSDLKVIGTIWNGGNVTKNGAGRLEISAPQGYTGTTTVNDGTLILGDGTNNVDLSNSHDVVIESGATLRLNYLVGNTDTIDELWLGGVQRSPGTYGAGTYSGVTITGTGTLTVLNGPPADPFAWINATSGLHSPTRRPRVTLTTTASPISWNTSWKEEIPPSPPPALCRRSTPPVRTSSSPTTAAPPPPAPPRNSNTAPPSVPVLGLLSPSPAAPVSPSPIKAAESTKWKSPSPKVPTPNSSAACKW